MITKSEKFKLKGHQNISDFIEDIEAEMGVTLMAREIDDEVNGYITLMQTEENGEDITLVEVHLYEEDETAEQSHGSLEPVLTSVTEGLSKTKQKEVRDKLAIVMGGHSTNLKKPDKIEEKLEKISNWRGNKKASKIG